jgi:CubicO group peptidase (beta-lactamase class C family)
MHQAGVPGLSIAVVEEGNLASSAGFGVKRADSIEPVADRTVFEAASLSKPVFAYAALSSYKTGLLDLDTPLTNYDETPYDAWGLDPIEPRLKFITMRHVLSHTSGLGNWQQSDIGRISFLPGDRFHYSGDGYIYLQCVLEKLWRSTLAEQMHQSVLQPLGMEDSSYVWLDRYESIAASGHGLRDEGAGRRWPAAFAAFSLYATAIDYALFLIQLIRNEEGPGAERNILTEMLTPQIRVSDKTSWGLGVGLESTNLGEWFWHWGDMGDFQSFALGSRERGQGVVILTNSGSGLSICEQLVEAITGVEHPCFSEYLYPYLPICANTSMSGLRRCAFSAKRNHREETGRVTY